MATNPLTDVVCGLIEKEGRFFWARKKPGKSQEGFWEMPGGKVQPGESYFAALQRELEEEFGMQVRAGEETKIFLDHGNYRLWLVPVIWVHGPEFLVDHDACGWFRAEEWSRLPMYGHERVLGEMGLRLRSATDWE
jgi:8-oxo-dGTP diphosphatase